MKKNILPKILRDPKYGHHRVVQLSGVKLHYVESGPRDKELLLFVHGFPDFWFTWKNQIQKFSKNYRVVAVDLRGYGESEKSGKTSFYQMNLLVDDIRQLVLALGRKTFTLIAHDWGGVIAHYFIRIHPEMLNRFILLNTVHLPQLSNSILRNPKQFFKSWYIILMQLPVIPELFFISIDLRQIRLLFRDWLTGEELNAYKYIFGGYEKIKGPINYYRASFRKWKKYSAPTAEKLNRRQVPGLYIHGKNDMALTLSTCFEKSFRDVENVSCVVIQNGGHFVHLQQPDVVNYLIEQFLNAEY